MYSRTDLDNEQIELQIPPRFTLTTISIVLPIPTP